MTVSTAVLRPPTIQRLAPRVVQQVEQAPNLLLTTLGQVARPFSQIEWPNPSARPPALELRTWVDALKIQLLVPFVQREWPVPGRAPAAQFADAPNLLASTLATAPVVQAPFAQREWPLPTEARSTVELRTWIDPLKVNLLVPFAQLDWPLSRGKANFFEGHAPNLLVGTLARPVAVPVEWAVPGRRIGRVDWLAPNTLVTTLAAITPFGQLEWPLPQATRTGVRAGLTDQPNNLLVSTLAGDFVWIHIARRRGRR